MPLTRRSPAVSSDSDHKAAVHAKNTGGNDNVRLVRVLPGRAGSGTVISLAKVGTRLSAQRAIYWMNDQRSGEIGPLLGIRDPSDIIDAVVIRKLNAMRTHAG